MKKLGIACLLFLWLLPAAKAQSSLHINKADFQSEFLDAINTRRAHGCNCGATYMKPAAPVQWNEQLTKAAMEHAKDMYRKNYFSHDSADGRTMEDRVQQFGYSYKGFQSYAIGENIAFNQQSIEEVMAGWFKSTGHCKNLMNPEFTEVGVAEFKYYWVQDFGGRVNFASR